MSITDVFHQGLFFISAAKPFVQRGRGNYEEHFCEIILNLDQWIRRRCR